jgi:hypothetical protein
VRIYSAGRFNNTGDEEHLDEILEVCGFHDHANVQETEKGGARYREDKPFIRGLLTMCLAAIDEATTNQEETATA